MMHIKCGNEFQSVGTESEQLFSKASESFIIVVSHLETCEVWWWTQSHPIVFFLSGSDEVRYHGANLFKLLKTSRQGY